MTELTERQQRGLAIRQARGTISMREFARLLNFDRATIERIEEGEPSVRLNTIRKLEIAVATWQQNMAHDAATASRQEEGDATEAQRQPVRITITGNFGVKATFECAPEDLAETEPYIERLIASMGRDQGPSEES